MKINNSLEWAKASCELIEVMNKLSYNKDLQRLYDNIEAMVAELSKIEVEVKRTHLTRKFTEKLAEVNKAIDYLEKLIMMARLIE